MIQITSPDSCERAVRVVSRTEEGGQVMEERAETGPKVPARVERAIAEIANLEKGTYLPTAKYQLSTIKWLEHLGYAESKIYLPQTLESCDVPLYTKITPDGIGKNRYYRTEKKVEQHG